MNVTITRNSDNGTETLGTLVLTKPDGSTWSCRTLERPWLNNQHNVSCIPAGTYQCQIQRFYATHMYEIMDVPDRTGIFLHPANYVTQLLGCIALGVNPKDINADGQIDVTSSQATVAAFMAECTNQPFTLQIIAV